MFRILYLTSAVCAITGTIGFAFPISLKTLKLSIPGNIKSVITKSKNGLCLNRLVAFRFKCGLFQYPYQKVLWQQGYSYLINVKIHDTTCSHNAHC